MKNKWYIKQYNNRLEQKANDTLRLIGDFISGEAKLRVPVDTGNLKSSIAYEMSHLSVAIGTNVKYGVYVELGTERQSAQPYLQPSLEDNRKKIQTFFNNMMKK